VTTTLSADPAARNRRHSALVAPASTDVPFDAPHPILQTGQVAASSFAGRWWVYDRPFLRDPLFIIGLVLGVISIGRVLASRDDYGWLALVLSLLVAVPFDLLVVGILAGSVREFLRGRAQRTRSG
jgi:hypothetical protein